MNTALPYWRSVLYVPANSTRFIAAAPRSGADAIQLDLEDSVLPAEKAPARDRLAEAIAAVGRDGKDVLVRINRPLSLAVRDIEAAVCAQVKAITVTKVDGADHVRLIDELVGECELRAGMQPGHTRLVLLVESVRALHQVEAIASASSRTVGLALGTEDFAADAHLSPEDEVMLQPKLRVVLAARAAGVLPMGFIGRLASLEDVSAFRTMLQRSRRFGFECATCIHPSQVSIVNEEYGVQAEELSQARHILRESETQASKGVGAFRLDGRMIDAPIVEQARRQIERAAQLSQFPPGR